MAGWYTNAIKKIGEKAYDLSADAINIMPVRTSGGGAGPYYTPDIDADTNLTDIPDNTDCRVVAPSALATVTWAKDGAGQYKFNSAAKVFSAVPASEAYQAYVIIHAATGDLLFLQDSGTGLPATPNNVDITYQPHANGIARLQEATP